jgi:hypothetical protein
MPVQLRRDEMVETMPVAHADSEEDGTFIGGFVSALTAGALWTLIAAPALMGGLAALEKTLIAGDELRTRHSGDHWQEVWTPMILFVFFGAIFGAFIAWRIAARTGMGGSVIALPVAVLSIILSITGLIFAAATFGDGVPVMCWLAMAIMTASAIGGALFYSKWTG